MTHVTESEIREDIRAFFQATTGVAPDIATRDVIVTAAATAAAMAAEQVARQRTAAGRIGRRRFGFGVLIATAALVAVFAVVAALNMGSDTAEPTPTTAGVAQPPVVSTTIPPTTVPPTTPPPATTVPPTTAPPTTVPPTTVPPTTVPGSTVPPTTVPTTQPPTTQPPTTTTEPTTTTVPPGPYPIRVTQQYGISSAPVPEELFFGTAEPGTDVVVSSDYGSAQGVADDDGAWSVEVTFSDPPLDTPFPVTVEVGSSTFIYQFMWNYRAIEVTQTFGSSDAPEPLERFYGTAPPGTAIVVSSDYGSAQGTADDDGNWSVDVAFVDAPFGTPFPVTVEVGSSTFIYQFTWTYDPANIPVTANQTYGSSANPVERFFGTAPPGTNVSITSEYGGASGVADSRGDWALEVRFVGAPEGTAFPVTVSVGAEGFGFEFVWNPDS
jgi:hypothetical protein